jgi:hypothetical protein
MAPSPARVMQSKKNAFFMFFLDCLTLEDEGAMILKNVGNHLPNNTVSYTR